MTENEFDLTETKAKIKKKKQIPENQVVGYCRCRLHRGAVTRALLRSHGCLGKCCRHFEKIDAPFWKQKDDHKQEQKLKKQLKAETERNESLWREECQQFADELEYPLRVLNVKKTEKPDHFVIFYISDSDSNDIELFVYLAMLFGEKHSAKAELRHAKDVYGNYATI